ncbi:hypothetical protein RRG08_004231 [Elysia crispata]|uniref:Secreted protein n=1 Tax=Elysia crispata TaxID=231223 RepID=A0AAE1DI08_9GAST|nr:hypothetical protein RRG08_004231 [Elysia crispata]
MKQASRPAVGLLLSSVCLCITSIDRRRRRDLGPYGTQKHRRSSQSEREPRVPITRQAASVLMRDMCGRRDEALVDVIGKTTQSTRRVASCSSDDCHKNSSSRLSLSIAFISLVSLSV